MKKLIGILFLLILTFGELSAKNQLTIDALKFENDDVKGITTFTKKVKITRIKDVITCNKMVLYTTANKNGKTNNRKIKKMVSTGNVKFKLYMKDKIYTGHGNTVIYEPEKLKYQIIGNGYLEEIKDHTKIFGNKIYLDQSTGYANVEGKDNKPVHFIMNIDAKQ
jgi:lipopolysaccharide export system protein LptA